MNLFASSPDPKECAIYLDDKRVNKMVIETAQMICTIAADDGKKNLPMKPTHHNHPVVQWAGATDSNLWWLIQHHYALSGEWTHRTGKIHAATLHEMYLPRHTTGLRPKTFQNSARNESRGLDFTWVEDVHRAYRMYLRARWLNDTLKPRWSKRTSPNWIEDYGTDDWVTLCQRAESTTSCPRCGDELSRSKRRIECVAPGCLVTERIPL